MAAAYSCWLTALVVRLWAYSCVLTDVGLQLRAYDCGLTAVRIQCGLKNLNLQMWADGCCELAAVTIVTLLLLQL